MAAVMLVDDDPETLAILKRFLESQGHRATCAAHGKEALGVMGREAADVVILDAVMPEMDGVQFLEVLRCYLRWQHTPVIMLTGYAEGPHIRRAAELGVMRTFLKSDYDLKELGAYVDALSPGGSFST